MRTCPEIPISLCELFAHSPSPLMPDQKRGSTTAGGRSGGTPRKRACRNISMLPLPSERQHNGRSHPTSLLQRIESTERITHEGVAHIARMTSPAFEYAVDLTKSVSDTLKLGNWGYNRTRRYWLRGAEEPDALHSVVESWMARPPHETSLFGLTVISLADPLG